MRKRRGTQGLRRVLARRKILLELIVLLTRARPRSDIDRSSVLKKISAFGQFQLWPFGGTVNPQAWLSNFSSDEEVYALHLLNSFVLFSERLTDQMLVSGFHDVSNRMHLPGETAADLAVRWGHLCETMIVTHVDGDDPNPTDSGPTIARRFRQALRIPKARVLDPARALEILTRGRNRPVLFVDDLAGTGVQFRATWERTYPLGAGLNSSFRELADMRPDLTVYYCPAIATEIGVQSIEKECRPVIVNPGNLLTEQHSLLDPQSILWPQDLAQSGPEFVQAASQRAGIPDLPGQRADWRGFHALGLAIAFSHGIPDSTLPIFWWDQNGWKPLMQRN